MGRSGARSTMAGKALLRTGKAFWNQTYDSARSTQRDYVRQGMEICKLLVLVMRVMNLKLSWIPGVPACTPQRVDGTATQKSDLFNG